MRLRVGTILVAAILLAPTASWADLAPYNQDFEGLAPTDGDPGVFNPSDLALIDDGWQVFGNVFCPNYVCYVGGYGPYGAPNGGFGGFAFSLVGEGQGGPEQGDRQLVVFSDYNNFNHSWALIESNVYQQQVIGADDVGKTWIFEFDAKRGDIQPPTTAAAFIKILNPGFIYIPLDMTNLSETWGSYSIPLYIPAEWEGRILQFGFLNATSYYAPSGNVYDNIGFRPEERSAGFWKHQCRDNGFTEVSQQELNDLLNDVAASTSCLPASCSVLDFTPPANSMREKAERQALTTALNLASGRLFETTPVDLTGLSSATRVGQAIDEIETTLCDSGASQSDLETAKDIAEALSNGGVDMGLVSETARLRVKPGERVTIPLGLINMTPYTESYALAKSGAWPVSLSQQTVDSLGTGQVAVVNADVVVPLTATKGRTARITVKAFDLSSGMTREEIITFEVYGTSGGRRGGSQPTQHQYVPGGE